MSYFYQPITGKCPHCSNPLPYSSETTIVCSKCGRYCVKQDDGNYGSLVSTAIFGRSNAPYSKPSSNSYPYNQNPATNFTQNPPYNTSNPPNSNPIPYSSSNYIPPYAISKPPPSYAIRSNQSQPIYPNNNFPPQLPYSSSSSPIQNSSSSSSDYASYLNPPPINPSFNQQPILDLSPQSINNEENSNSNYSAPPMSPIYNRTSESFLDLPIPNHSIKSDEPLSPSILHGIKKNSEEPPASFICPITCEIMEDPVISADGHSYEKEAIKTWFSHHNTSPLTNQVLSTKNLIPNYNLRSQIKEWKDRNKSS